MTMDMFISLVRKYTRALKLTPQQRSQGENKKDECPYSLSNAIRTLVMVREAGLEPARA